jgi:hypothetical protein
MAAFLLPLALSHTVASANALIEDHTSLLSGVYLSQNMQITINATSFQVNGVKAKLNRDGSYSAERMSDLLGEGSFVILSPEKLEYTSADGTTAFEHSFGLTPDTETELADKRLLQWVEGELNTKASGISKSSAPDFAAFDRIIASAPNPDALKYYFSRHKASLLFFDELRRNTEEEEVDVRRTNMDRLSAIFQHVHVSTLPRLHWGMLARYASSKVETEGSGNGDNSFGNFLHVNGEQVMESWETAWMRKLAKFGLSKVRTLMILERPPRLRTPPSSTLSPAMPLSLASDRAAPQLACVRRRRARSPAPRSMSSSWAGGRASPAGSCWRSRTSTTP